MHPFKRTTMVLLALACLSILAAPAAAKDIRQELAQESTLEKVMQQGVLRVGFSTFVPWAMKDKNGKFVGFEIEVAEKLAEDMGVKVQFVPTKWSGIIPALLTGKFDIIIGGMGIRPQRNLKVNFTEPYEFTGMSIVANKEVAPGYDSLDDFNKPEVVLAIRLGTTAVDAAKKHMPKAKIKLFDEEAQAIQELLNGRAHAVVASNPLPEFTAVDYPGKLYLPLEGATFTREPIGFAVRKGDYDYVNFLNNWIRVKTYQGWLKERFAYWFTTKKWKSMVE